MFRLILMLPICIALLTTDDDGLIFPSYLDVTCIALVTIGGLIFPLALTLINLHLMALVFRRIDQHFCRL